MTIKINIDIENLSWRIRSLAKYLVGLVRYIILYICEGLIGKKVATSFSFQPLGGFPIVNL